MIKQRISKLTAELDDLKAYHTEASKPLLQNPKPLHKAQQTTNLTKFDQSAWTEDFKIDRKNIKLETMVTSKLSSVLDGTEKTSQTIIAIKDKNSYAAIQSNFRISIIEKGVEVYSEEFKDLKKRFSDVIYMPNRYYLYETKNPSIYIKDPDSSEVKLFCRDLQGNSNFGRAIRPALNGKGIFFRFYANTFSCMEVTPEGTKGRELEHRVGTFNSATEFASLGPKGNYLVSITYPVWLNLTKFDFEKMTSESIFEDRIKHEGETAISLTSLAVCPRSKYVAVSTRSSNPSMGVHMDKILIYEFTEGTLALKDSASLRHDKLPVIYSLCFGRYYGDYMTLVGVSKNPHTPISVFVVDAEDSRVFEVKGQRGAIFESKDTVRLLRVGDMFYTSNSKCDMIEISVKH